MLGKITEKQEIAVGTLLVKIDLLGQPLEFKPGQFFFITLPDIPYPDPRNGRRHFSIVSSPNQKGYLEFATRLREESFFKKYLKELPLGSEVKLGPFNGKFTLPEDISKEYVFIAGGIGITPFISMLRYVQEEKSSHKITLIYSNKDKNSTAFLEELYKMEQHNPNLNLILTMTEDENWEREKGRIDSDFILKHLPIPNSYSYYIAGSPQMVDGAEKSLIEAGVEQTNIIKENFSGY